MKITYILIPMLGVLSAGVVAETLNSNSSQVTQIEGLYTGYGAQGRVKSKKNYLALKNRKKAKKKKSKKRKAKARYRKVSKIKNKHATHYEVLRANNQLHYTDTRTASLPVKPVIKNSYKIRSRNIGIPKTVHQLKVTLHQKSGYNTADIQRILTKVNGLLGDKSSYRDLNANVRFTTKGPVTIDNSGSGVVRTEQDFRNLCTKKTSHVIVIKSLKWCDRKGRFIGCTYPQYKCMVITKVRKSWESILWAHELGHMGGLPHREQYNALMKAVVYAKNIEINHLEKVTYEISNLSYNNQNRYYGIEQAPRYWGLESIQDPPSVWQGILNLAP